MRKLGYTWYPKDWATDLRVFRLNLSCRGMYRELIDAAMLSDNKVRVEVDLWERMWGSSRDEIETNLRSLRDLGLVRTEGGGNFITIPSCEKRLSFKRNGGKGGESTANGTANGTADEEANDTPKEKVKEKVKGKEKVPTYEEFLDYAKEQEIWNDNMAYQLKSKYESWKENNWKDGNGNIISNWKNKLRSTLPYFKNAGNKKPEKLSYFQGGTWL